MRTICVSWNTVSLDDPRGSLSGVTMVKIDCPSAAQAAWGTVLFLASMAIQGVAGAFVGSAPAAVVGDIMGRRRGGIVVAAFQMTSDIGTIIGPLVAGALIDTLGFGWAFGVGAAISLTAVTLVYLMPETLTRKPAVE